MRSSKEPKTEPGIEKIRSLSQIKRLEAVAPRVILENITSLRRAVAEMIDFIETLPEAKKSKAWKKIKKAGMGLL